jgi:hypothetical protein
MFAILSPAKSEKQRPWRLLSLVLHGIFLAWLVHTPEPQLLNPISITKGDHGRVLSRLYFPSRAPDDSDTSSSSDAKEIYRHQRLGHEKLT